MIAGFIFILGIIFGSFYNVVIYRVPLEKSVMRGRSICPHCKHVLSVMELIPIVSILVQRFKCRYCCKSISCRYLIVEIGTGLLWTLCYLIYGHLGPWMVLSACLLTSLCIITSYIDFDTRYISDSVLIICWLCRLLVMLMTGESYIIMLMSMLLGAFIYFIIYFVSKAYYKREAFGMGDIFYIAVLGSWFSPLDITLVAYGSFVVAGFLLLILSIFKRFRRNQEVPFSPAMSVMAIIMYLLGNTMKEVYLQWVF